MSRHRHGRAEHRTQHSAVIHCCCTIGTAAAAAWSVYTAYWLRSHWHTHSHTLLPCVSSCWKLITSGTQPCSSASVSATHPGSVQHDLDLGHAAVEPLRLLVERRAQRPGRHVLRHDSRRRGVMPQPPSTCSRGHHHMGESEQCACSLGTPGICVKAPLLPACKLHQHTPLRR